MGSFLLMVLLLLFIFIGIPVSIATGAAGSLGVLLLKGNPMQTIPQAIYSGVVSFPLLAMPFFIMAGELMNASGITAKLIRFANLLVGRLPAGLAHTNVTSAMIFSGISGSIAADTSAIGGVMIPAMEKAGYPKDFSAALTACATINGPIIPPSILMVMYGTSVNVSIGALFAAGFMPGLLIAGGLMITVLIMNHFHKYPRSKEKLPAAEVKAILKDSIIPLLMPVVILGGILGGVFSPTEAGAVAVVYALIVGFGVLRTLKFKQLLPMLWNTAIVTSTVLFIIGTAGILGWVLTMLRVQEVLGSLIISFSSSPYVFLFLVNIILLLIGTFMDSGVGIILFAPILAPIAQTLGIDPIHFGLIMVLNMTLGQVTPPLGTNLFIACGISRLSMEKVSRAILPFLASEVVVLFLITYIPEVTLWIPRLLGYVS